MNRSVLVWKRHEMHWKPLEISATLYDMVQTQQDMGLLIRGKSGCHARPNLWTAPIPHPKVQHHFCIYRPYSSSGSLSRNRKRSYESLRAFRLRSSYDQFLGRTGPNTDVLGYGTIYFKCVMCIGEYRCELSYMNKRKIKLEMQRFCISHSFKCKSKISIIMPQIVWKICRSRWQAATRN